MLISGFTMVKNADKLYYPIKHAIESILPIVDEFVVALGNCDADDNTESLIKSIDSDKVKIIHTVWDIEKYPNGMENAHQTDIAKSHCKGKWCFYLQADELVHEKYLPMIKKRCEELADDNEVEALLFNYVHFWGDYNHYQHAHGWYKKEIRIVKNHPDIHSWISAQSFRRIPNFDGLNYRVKEGTFKLKAVLIDAKIYHYGWVRPPQMMQSKKKSLDTIHKGTEKVNSMYNLLPGEYDYGPLGRASKFKGSHPAVLKEWIEDFHWGDKLNYSRKELNPGREKNKHDRPKYRFVTFLEQYIFGGREIFGTKNYILVKR